MNEPLQTLAHAQQTVTDFAIQLGPKLVVTGARQPGAKREVHLIGATA